MRLSGGPPGAGNGTPGVGGGPPPTRSPPTRSPVSPLNLTGLGGGSPSPPPSRFGGSTGSGGGGGGRGSGGYGGRGRSPVPPIADGDDDKHGKYERSGSGLPVGRWLLAALAVRLAQAALVGTYAAPDEWWQAPEVAHRLAYGTGVLTWEWWPPYEIRSALHPLLLAGAHRAAIAVGGADAWRLVAVLPHAVHALLAAATDVATGLLAFELFRSNRIARHAFAAQLLAWFAGFGLPRPFANSLEACLSTVALWLWVRGQADLAAPRRAAPPSWQRHPCDVLPPLWRLSAAGALAGLAVAARPTAAVTWAAVGAACLLEFGLTAGIGGGGGATLLRAAAAALPPAAAALALGVAADSWFYGHLTWSGANFVRVNVLQHFDALYGAYPRYWYLVDGLPAVCGPALPLVALGASKLATRRERALLGGVVAANVAALSAAAHKEHRFLLPLVPLLSILAGRGLHALQQASQGAAAVVAGLGISPRLPNMAPPTAAMGGAAGAGAGAGGGLHLLRARCCRWSYAAALAAYGLASLAAVAYFNGVHQAGPVSAVRAVAAEAADVLHATVPRRRPAAAVAAESHTEGEDGDEPSDDPLDGGGGDPFGGGDGGGDPLGEVESTRAITLMSLHVLAGCHAAPAYALLHAPIELVALDCSPPPAAAWARRELAASLPNGDEHALPPGAAALTALPRSEADLWRANPGGFLEALYGLPGERRAPKACDYDAPPPRTLRRRANGGVYGDAAAAAADSGDEDELARLTQQHGHAAHAHDDEDRDTGAEEDAELAAAASAARRRRLSDGPYYWHGRGDARLGPDGGTFATGAAAYFRLLETGGHGPAEVARPAGSRGEYGEGDGSIDGVDVDAPPVEPTHRRLPSHVIVTDADAAVPDVAGFLASSGYHVADAQSFFHAHVSGDAHAAPRPGGAHPARVLLLRHECWTRLRGGGDAPGVR